MKSTLLSAVIVGVLATISGVLAGLTAGEQSSAPVVRVTVTIPEYALVPIAVKDIPVWTKFTKDNVSDYFVYEKILRGAVPTNAVLDLDELSGKWTTSPIPQGEMVRPSGLGSKTSIDPPEGTVATTIRIPVDASEAGFCLPGYKVIVAVTKKSESKKKEVLLPIAIDALILAVEPGDTPAARLHVTLAFTPEQCELLAPALEAGAIQLHLPRSDEGLGYKLKSEVARSAEDVRAFLADE